MHTRAVLLALVACGAQVSYAQSPPAPLPSLALTMTPHASEGDDSHLGVLMTLSDPKVKPGEPLLRMPLKIVGIPTARYDGDLIKAADAAGPLPLVAEDEAPTPQWINRHWNVTRATVGDVTVSYQAPPRRVTAATNNGPLFDLRQEAGGFIGAGVGFLALPAAKGPFHVRLKWDLSGAPGSRGVWSLGEGEVEADIPTEALAYSYYAVGPLKSIPHEGGGKFGLYWLTPPPFDAAALGARIETLYAGMSKFFGDEGSSYRVFMRRNPYAGKGGSALAHSFMFGYNADEKPTIDDLQSLLAHEMTHNWPALEGEHGDTAWYSEGTAEYYSIILSYRAGLLSVRQFLDEINERADAYYANPFIRLTNSEAAKIFWTDPTAQTVPYGRGFMYLTSTDAAIRAKSHGKESLDQVVLGLYRRETRHEPYGIPQWLDLVAHQLGRAETERMYHAMAEGRLEVPKPSSFAPCLATVRKSVHTFQLGFARASLNDQRIVRDLVAGSAAATAGIKEGDELVDVKGLVEANRDESKPITLTVKRPEGPITISYLPRGHAVESYGWVRNPKAPESTCKF
jgi:hypothetical protein